MKILFASDLHSHNSHLYSLPIDVDMSLPAELEFLKQKSYWNLLTDRMLDSLIILHYIYSIAAKIKADRIYHLGDLFHKKTPGLALAVMVDVLNKLNGAFGIELYLLPGNHDSFKAWSYLSALVRPGAIVLLGSPQAEVVRLSKLQICSLPYTARIPEWYGWLSKVAPESSRLKVLLLFHQDILNFQLSSGHRLQSGVDLGRIANLVDVWFSGHIHKHAFLGRGVCVGSALPINFTDAGSDHGCVVYDSSRHHWEFKAFPKDLVPGFARVQLKDVKKVSRLDFPNNTEYLWVDVIDPGAKRTHLDAIRAGLEKYLRCVHITQPVKFATSVPKRGDKEKKKMFIDKRYAIAEWAKEKGIDPELGLEIYDQVSST